MPEAKPLTAADFPPFVKPEDIAGLSQTEMREKLERLRGDMRAGILTEDGEARIDDSVWDPLPVTAPGDAKTKK